MQPPLSSKSFCAPLAMISNKGGITRSHIAAQSLIPHKRYTINEKVKFLTSEDTTAQQCNTLHAEFLEVDGDKSSTWNPKMGLLRSSEHRHVIYQTKEKGVKQIFGQ